MATAFQIAERARKAEARGDLRRAAELYHAARRQYRRCPAGQDSDQSWPAYWEGCAATCDHLADVQASS